MWKKSGFSSSAMFEMQFCLIYYMGIQPNLIHFISTILELGLKNVELFPLDMVVSLQLTLVLFLSSHWTCLVVKHSNIWLCTMLSYSKYNCFILVLIVSILVSTWNPTLSYLTDVNQYPLSAIWYVSLKTILFMFTHSYMYVIDDMLYTCLLFMSQPIAFHLYVNK